jgi:hypothetical protein
MSRGPLRTNSQRTSQGWEALEERRLYGGGSIKQATREAREGLLEALREGYIVDKVEWAADSRSVTVHYIYDPARTARPL